MKTLAISTNGGYTLWLGDNPHATGGNAVALGAGASATGSNSVALGAQSTDAGLANVVSVGGNGLTRTITNVTAGVNATDAANVGQVQAVQVQIAAIVNGQAGVCTVSASGGMQCSIPGQAASVATGSGAIAVGNGAQATGAGAIAQGQGAVASFAGAVAIGAGAQATADPTTAIGNNAIASATNATAIGANAVASATNSVALGQGSIADRANSVSVGSAQQTRQITNVAAGTSGTDAVNLNQLNASVSGIQNQITSSVAALQHQVRQDIDKMGASALAASQIAMPTAPGKTTIGVGVGTSGGQEAVALGIAHMPEFAKGVTFRVTVAAASSTVSGGAGVSVQF